MTAKDHFLFAAVKGIILCLNCETMETVHIFDAYYKAVRSLLIINYSGAQSKPFSRMLSMDKSFKPESLSYGPQSYRQSSSDSLSPEDYCKNSILVSFGVGFKGVMRDCADHPENLILPSEGSRTSFQPALPDRDVGYLLLWSTEVATKKEQPDKHATELPEMEEKEELSLPDDIVAGL